MFFYSLVVIWRHSVGFRNRNFANRRLQKAIPRRLYMGAAANVRLVTPASLTSFGNFGNKLLKQPTATY